MVAGMKNKILGTPPPNVVRFVRACITEKKLSWEKIVGDGSERRFYRIRGKRRSWVVMIQDHPQKNKRGVNENDSFLYIGQHLKDKEIPVPEIYHQEKERGLFLLEDFGDVHLQNEVMQMGSNQQRVKEIYQHIIDILILTQVQGAKGFDPSQTHNPPYDKAFMLAWESGYFHFAFLVGYLGLSILDEELRDELEDLAHEATQAQGGYFLYRDFQSRNIMVRDKEFGFLDFQGARLGPLQYDLASLLLDPYVALKEEIQEELMAYYLMRIQEYEQLDAQHFKKCYPFVAVHRNMQVLGAFAFLIRARGREFYQGYIPIALKSLRVLLKDKRFDSYKQLRRVVFKEIKGI
jgi:aminoglycoside/choline kinase family phosphotransferase